MGESSTEPTLTKTRSPVRELGLSRRPRAWFWTASDGKVYISLRYGARVIEIAKGKSAIEVGEKRQLVPVIEALKKAVAARELDSHVDAAGTEVAKRFLKVGRQ